MAAEATLTALEGLLKQVSELLNSSSLRGFYRFAHAKLILRKDSKKAGPLQNGPAFSVLLRD